MKIINTYLADMLNGEGLRDVYFFSGCSHHCPGCFNKETWDPDVKGARTWTPDDFEKMIENASQDYISGITLTGGDPLYLGNRQDILKLCQDFKHRLPGKTIWLYTGYLVSDIKEFLPELLDYVDVVCEGRYVDSLKSPDKPWVGSSNQNVVKIR